MAEVDHIPDNRRVAQGALRARTQVEVERAVNRVITRSIVKLTVIVFVILLLWFAWSVLLYGFCGVLIAVAFRGCVVWTARKTGFSERISYGLVLVSATVVVVASVYLLAPRVAAQTSQIAAELPDAWGRVRDHLRHYELGRQVVDRLSGGSFGFRGGALFSKLGGDLVDVIAGLIAALVLGLYAAANPGWYLQGLLRLVPEKRRVSIAALTSEVGYVLKWWTLGQLVPMAVLGIATMIGLWLMQIPLAFTLGLFTGIMIFIPYAGALLAAIPVILIALLQGPSKMVWVVVFYLAVHLVEGYALTPFVQRRAVRLPPALTILAQVLMWSMAGVLGVIVATPMAAASLVLIKRLVLHQTGEVQS